MAALDVVGVDFQLGLGVDHRAFREQQVLVRLSGVGFLRVLMDDDLAVEHPASTAAQNPFVEL